MAEGDDRSKTYNWKELFTTFRFVPTDYGGMKGKIEDIEISAIGHPLKGVSVTATHFGGRSATQFENFLPTEVTIEEVGKLFVHIIGQIHPERVQELQADVPPVPETTRPSNHESSRQPADLLPSMPNVDQLRQIAQRLKEKGGYWRTFLRIEALMGWLHHSGRCVYCNVNLVDGEHMVEGLATTDHVLPKRKYPELDFTDRNLAFRDYLNAVPACDGCNCLKGSWDPTMDGGPQLYKRGMDQLTCEMQREFVRRATTYIAGEREKRRLSNQQDQRSWASALSERNGLDG